MVTAGIMLLCVALLAYLAAATLLTLWQRQFIFPGAFATAPARFDPPPGFVLVIVSTPDGERLRALWKPPRPGCGMVLSFHGNGDRPEVPAARFGAGRWAADGWGVMVIAYRGYAGSTGITTGEGLALDAVAAYDEARRRAPDAPVLVHGHSLGTWAAVSAASHRPVLGLYLEAPFRSMASLVSHMFRWLPTALLLRDPMRSDLLLPKVQGPVVIVHGDRDGLIPAASGRALAGSRPSNTTFDLVPADHVSVLGLDDDRWEPYFSAMMAGPACAGAKPPG